VNDRSATPKALDLRIVKKAAATAGLALFAVIRDEDYFLQFFFDHYRAMGVETFLIYDDRSGEPTRTYLRAQPDCSIMESEHTFGDRLGALHRFQGPRRLSAALKESVAEWAFPNRWVLTVDADEFLILPPEFPSLGQLVAHLETTGQPYLTAPMVDFHGPTLNHRLYDPRIGPFEANRYFDAGPYYHWRQTPEKLPAGVRYRIMQMLSQRCPEQFWAIANDGLTPPHSWKAPLLRNGAGVVRNGDHELSITPSTALTGALAHFKFCPGLDEKVAVALRENQYSSASKHYRYLDMALRTLGDEPLIAPQTRRFEGPHSLVEAALMSAPGSHPSG
jgi:hypothetical protein